MKYDEYRFSITEYIKYMLIFFIISGVCAYVFYDSVYAFAVLLPGSVAFFKYEKKVLISKRKRELKCQFQEMIDSVATALIAGYSVENSFHEAYKDMIRLYGTDSYIANELIYIFSKTDIGSPIELVLNDFANRARIEDITDFADIFCIAKRNGGNFNQIIKRTVGIMKEKEETEKDIEVLLSGRRFEQRIMCIIPFFIIVYLKLSSKSYLSILYHNSFGIIVMTVCLVFYFLSYCISLYIIDIHV